LPDNLALFATLTAKGETRILLAMSM